MLSSTPKCLSLLPVHFSAGIVPGFKPIVGCQNRVGRQNRVAASRPRLAPAAPFEVRLNTGDMI